MEAVDVLRHDGHALAEIVLEGGDGDVGGVRFRLGIRSDRRVRDFVSPRNSYRCLATRTIG